MQSAKNKHPIRAYQRTINILFWFDVKEERTSNRELAVFFSHTHTPTHTLSLLPFCPFPCAGTIISKVEEEIPLTSLEGTKKQQIINSSDGVGDDDDLMVAFLFHFFFHFTSPSRFFFIFFFLSFLQITNFRFDGGKRKDEARMGIKSGKRKRRTWILFYFYFFIF
eukprot:TRINITY_DN135_c0_g1_i2.p1 TRINITY_DN135_c0_g1~~TRINITY_DN135_c0_g1_i2.p1  ORF type:complete len:166 (+),score=15.47 TRINITY_DN135_c0_g1_i2:298-795(+)